MIAPTIGETRKKTSRLANFFSGSLKRHSEAKLSKCESTPSLLAVAAAAASATGNLHGYEKFHRKTRAHLSVKILIFISKGICDWLRDKVSSPEVWEAMATETRRVRDFLSEVVWLCVQAVMVIFEEGLKTIMNILGKQLDRPKCVRGMNVLVTGSAGALGRRMAARLALAHGARLVLWDLDQESVDQVAQEIAERGGKAFAYQCDVTNDKQVEETAKRVLKEVGDIDILINNAAILHCRPLLQLSSKDIRKTLDVNLLAHYLTTKQFLPRMLARGSGQVVAVASVAGFIGTANMTDYCGSKFGVVGFMESLEEELESTPGGDAIQLTTVCPVAFRSGLVHRMESRFPVLFPILEADDIAEEAVLAILNDEEHVVIPRRVGYIARLSNLLPRRITKMGQRFCAYASDAILTKDGSLFNNNNNNHSPTNLKLRNSFANFVNGKMNGSKRVKDVD